MKNVCYMTKKSMALQMDFMSKRMNDFCQWSKCYRLFTRDELLFKFEEISSKYADYMSVKYDDSFATLIGDAFEESLNEPNHNPLVCDL